MIGFCIVSVCLIVFSYVQLIKYQAWWIRIFDFVHIQLSVAILITLVLGFMLLPDTLYRNVVCLALVVTLLYHLHLIIPFTPIYRKQVLDHDAARASDCLRIMVSNVYQDNTHYQDVIELIKNTDADIVLLVETNGLWEKALSVLSQTYPFSVPYPLENTYGMMLYSRLKIVKEKIFFLVENDIPSFELSIQLPSGQLVDIYTVHPQPPSPTENERSTERDAELLIVAKKVKAKDRPTVVMGDLNDVAWSHTTRLFGRMSGLLDPRIGRGLFNTFHAKVPFMRFPLDHVFSSHHFTLQKIERLPFCNSDHFPIYIELCFQPKEESKKNQDAPTKRDHEEANEKLDEAKNS